MSCTILEGWTGRQRSRLPRVREPNSLSLFPINDLWHAGVYWPLRLPALALDRPGAVLSRAIPLSSVPSAVPRQVMMLMTPASVRVPAMTGSSVILPLAPVVIAHPPLAARVSPVMALSGSRSRAGVRARVTIAVSVVPVPVGAVAIVCVPRSPAVRAIRRGFV